MLGTVIAWSSRPTRRPACRKSASSTSSSSCWWSSPLCATLRWSLAVPDLAGIGSLTAIRGFVQFAGKMQEAHQAGRGSYDFYVGERITGFTSHWNTYSAEEMFASS